MSAPLVSVVIPTHRRPHFLPRAIDSAIDGMGSDVEIIVVPNGPDTSWQGALAAYASDPRVRIDPIAREHANAARNHGMDLARGKYIRFLDDDDYLYPSNAARQYESLERSAAGLSAASVDIVDERGGAMFRYDVPAVGDIVAATLQSRRNTLPTMYVFKRDIVRSIRWNEAVDFNQDTQWMLDLVASADIQWVRESECAGVWRIHTGERVSSNIPSNLRCKTIAGMLDGCAASLVSAGRMTQERQNAYADGLWACAHMAFVFSPLYWSRVMRRALALDPGCHSENTIYSMAGKIGVPPLAMEWSSLPLRYLKYGVKHLLAGRYRNDGSGPKSVGT